MRLQQQKMMCLWLWHPLLLPLLNNFQHLLHRFSSLTSLLASVSSCKWCDGVVMVGYLLLNSWRFFTSVTMALLALFLVALLAWFSSVSMITLIFYSPLSFFYRLVTWNVTLIVGKLWLPEAIMSRCNSSDICHCLALSNEKLEA